ncbi:MAG: S1/P1 nuclease [Alistipes sp.]|nr:S1/P1 nuclease [Alistipes sp.]
MKRILTLMCAVVLVVSTASAWGRLGHATVAKIAENHLTKKAKKQITEYLHGESIVKWASYADECKPELLVDLGFEPTNAKRHITYPHTFEATADCTPYPGIRKGDEYVKNCIYYIEKMAAELKDNAKDMPDSVRVAHIALIVHFVGDMHCPEHIRYPEDQTIGYYPIYFGKDKVRYHTLWDTPIIASRHPWGFEDTAALLDTYTKQQIKDVTAGTPYDWGYDSAKASRPVHDIKEGTKLDKRQYLNQYTPLAEEQIRKAGYRLASLLNSIF